MSNIAAITDAAKWDTRFSDLWALGFRRLVPILPPDAQVSPDSSYAKNLAVRGKAPGVKKPDGLWWGFNFTTCEATESDLRKWAKMGAGVGIKTGPLDPAKPDGEWLVGIDSDVLNADSAREVDKIVHKHFGALPCRIGKRPKALYPIRVSGPIHYMKVMFGPATTAGRPEHAVEILGAMKQFVAPPSIHPGTGQPYHWARPIVPLAEIPMTTPDALKAFMDELLTAMPNATTSSGSISRDRAGIDQAALAGDPDKLEKALRAMPNTVALFPTYESMTTIGEACHAAFASDRDRGLEAFQEWVSKWDGFTSEDQFDPWYIAGKWESYKEPHSIGADYLYKLAAKHAPDKFHIAEVWFDDLPEPAAQEEKGAAGAAARTAAARSERFTFLTVDECADQALNAGSAPLVDGLLDAGALSVLYGDSNVGKTFVAMDLAYAIAQGRPYAGMETTPGAVVYVAAEGGVGAKRRVKALHDKHGPYGIDDLPVPFLLLPSSVDLRDDNADLAPLLEAFDKTARRVGNLVLIVIDTLSRAMSGGDENSSVDMGALVKHFDLIRERTGAHLMVVHHTGKNKIQGARGHSILRAAIDTELEVDPGVVRVTKQREMEGGWSTGFRLESAPLGLDSRDRPVTSAIVRLCSEEEGRATALRRQHCAEDTAAKAHAADVAKAVCRALQAPGSYQLGAHYADIGEALRAARIIKAVARRRVTKEVSESLAACPVTVERDGETLFVSCAQEGDSSTAPWVLHIEAADHRAERDAVIQRITQNEEKERVAHA